jgi:hypothetical protein
VLCEAAQTARPAPQFATTFQAIARRRGKKIATTAVARKLHPTPIPTTMRYDRARASLNRHAT